MNSLIDLIKQNQALTYLDVDTNQSATLPEILAHTASIPGDPKSLAFIYADNSLESISTILAFWNSTHTIALLNPKLPGEMKERLEALYRPTFVYDQERSSITHFEQLNWINKGPLFYKKRGDIMIHPDLKLLLTTSGTTGSPKFVKLSEQNIVSNALSILNYLPIIPTDITPLNLPVFYAYGFSVFTTNSIKAGKVICSNKDVLQKEFWTDLEKYGYTSLSGVPYLYEILKRIGFTEKSYPSLKYLTQAGGKLKPAMVSELSKYCVKNGINFFVMYGQTEATARMSYLPPADLNAKPDSIGKAIPGGHFEIIPETNELVYEGENVFGGYAQSREDLKSFDKNRKLFTGDLARMDENGFFYITGRINRFVKLFGNRINLDEVEEMLKNAFPLSDFACAGNEDKYLLIFEVGAKTSNTDTIDFLVDKLKLHPSAIKVIPVEKIPTTASGKTDYSELNKYYLS